MDDEAQFATAIGAEVQSNVRPSPSEGNSTEYVKDDAVRVHVHDETPLLQQPGEGSGYGSLPPFAGDTGPSGVDTSRSWRRPSVSAEAIPSFPCRCIAP